MTPTELDIFIRIQKIKPADLATAIGVSPGDLSSTISGARTNHFVRVKLSRYFRKPINVLFGADFEREVAASRQQQVA
jgi:hypothetical protein